MASVESSGVAKAGMITGITSLGILGAGLLNGNNCGNGLLGGLFGNNCHAGMAGMAGMAAQGAYQAAISAKDAEIGQLKAEKYADGVGTGVYAALNSQMKEAYQELVVTRERLATADANFKCLSEAVSGLKVNVAELNREAADAKVREQRNADAVECLAKSTTMRFDAVYNSIDCAKKEFGSALALESERRSAGDQNLMCYVNATFVPGKLVMPKDAICPSVMPQYNSWTAPTGTAPDTQPISGTVTATVVNR